MGCTYSGQSGRHDGSVRSFRVHNVDDQGVELHRGTIEIRDNDLVLYQRGKDEIRWPLRCLRRYGFDAELFSFESGRRCQSGAGIYAFKCAHAEDLFNLVQESIQRAGEEDQRGQQHNHTHAAAMSGPQHNTRPTPNNASETQVKTHDVYGIILPNGVEGSLRPDSDRNNDSHLYVNGILANEVGHEYVNTGTASANSGAFQIDETAALIDFLHNPPGGGGGGASRSQVNYAELCMPDGQASLENLSDETGQGAIHNVDRRVTGAPDVHNRLSQHSLPTGGHGAENNRLSMPIDPLGAASQDNDSILQSADSDVFLADAPPESLACPNYVNIALEDGAAAASAPVPSPTAAPPACREIVFPPTHEVVANNAVVTNYANLALQPPRAPKVLKQVNYIVIDHKNQSNDNLPGGQGNANNSPTSPTSCVSLPESPSRKTESYALIDFDRTAALSNTTRPVEDEGGRKTRHNSTISDMP